MRIEFGISAALVTPFDENGHLDHSLMLSHAKHALEIGADGVTLFGTTGEGASMSQSERVAALTYFNNNGFEMKRVTVAIYANAIADAIEQAQAAFDQGARKILLPPPFYFKGVSDTALRNWFVEVLAGLPEGLQVILYHIPQVTMVPLSPALVHKLQKEFPAQIVGLKDSSGKWENTALLLENPDLAVLVGDERHLAKAGPLGCAGAISGMANLCPTRLKDMIASGEDDEALFVLVNAVVALPVTPAVKSLVGHTYGDDRWNRVRLPFEETQQSALPQLFSLLASMNGQAAE